MRFEGNLCQWNGERGFGFLKPVNGGQEIFVHISAFPRDGRHPQVGEPLSFEVATDTKGQKRAQQVQRPSQRQTSTTTVPQRLHRPEPKQRSKGVGGGLVVLMLVVTIGAWGYTQFSRNTLAAAALPIATPAIDPAPTTTNSNTSAVRCDGRTYCSQMTSCAEAKFFLKNCPGTAMDGNHDGVPCEKQWCTSPGAR